MRVAYASDIHSEFMRRPRVALFDKHADVIVLAGDIGVGAQAIGYAEAVADAYPRSVLVWVPGNHEFYGSDLDEQLNQFRRFAEGRNRIHFLENDAARVDGLRFLGCTLWTDFSVMGEKAASDCKLWGWRRLADGSNIRRRGRPLSCEDIVERFQTSHRWLEAELRSSDPATTVVVTHFPPCREARHREIPEDYLTAYFQSNAMDLIDRFQPRFWIYGHNHWSDRLRFGETLLVSNQLGYRNERDSLEHFTEGAFFDVLI